jgi:hypothetical protein
LFAQVFLLRTVELVVVYLLAAIEVPMKTIFLLLFLFPVTISAQKYSGNQKPDTLEYAPGYPEYSISQIDQLKSFPLPRYFPASLLRRNFPWFDFMYMAYDYSKVTVGKDGHFLYPDFNKKGHALAALEMNIEMYNHWHYYFNIPTPTYNYKNFLLPNTIPGAQVKYADQHPDVQTCTYIFWSGVRPKDIGYITPKPFIKFNVNIDPCNGDTSYPKIAIDGRTQRFYLSKLAVALPHRDSLRKIDFVNENGEVFGEAWTPNAEGYHGNELIKCIQPDSENARDMRARWQYNVFNSYKKQFIGTDSLSGFKNSYFSFYQVAGFLPYYYSEWTEMRYINSSFHDSYYSTPDFYPGQADHSIFPRYSFYHGLDCMEEGRKYEISKGDYYFSPFIAAGWFQDSLNYRPAAWLAATKALAMMGAEFYYPAFFNTSNPATKIPIDPRGYIYQVVMPAYAQAITSRYQKIFFDSKDFSYIKKDDKLVIYRTDNSNPNGPVYAIHASVFSPGNFVAAPDQCTEKVNINGDELKINLRKQGSTYIYDKSDPGNTVFYQLDSWHEATHPYYWTKDFVFEAEVTDDTISHLLKTELPPGAEKNDYTDFTTYVSFANADISKKTLRYDFEPRNDTQSYYIWIRARSIAGNSKTASCIKFQLDEGAVYEIKGINNKNFQWYCYKSKGVKACLQVTPDVQHELKVIACDQFLELDKIILSKTQIPVGINKKEIVSPSLN